MSLRRSWLADRGYANLREGGSGEVRRMRLLAFPRLRHLWMDAGYRGEDKGADWVKRALGWSVDLVERPKKPAPEEVL